MTFIPIELHAGRATYGRFDLIILDGHNSALACVRILYDSCLVILLRKAHLASGRRFGYVELFYEGHGIGAAELHFVYSVL